MSIYFNLIFSDPQHTNLHQHQSETRITTITTTMTSTMTVETIKLGFTYPTIECQPGLPSYQTILATHKKLKENAASVQRNFGGGRHGLLGLATNI